MGGEGLAEDVARVREYVRAGGLLESEEPLVAMLSGGRDSVCLLDVAVALRDARKVSALHVNYGLREQADADERHCARLCEAVTGASSGGELHGSIEQRQLLLVTLDQEGRWDR